MKACISVFLIYVVTIFNVINAQELEYLLPEATISSAFNKPPVNASFLIRHKADSNYQYTLKSTSGMLREDGIYLKAYNEGGLNTAGSRGYGSSHTKVFWNGFLLNSPLNGTIDLGLQALDPLATDILFNKSNSPVEGSISGAGGSIWISDRIPKGDNAVRAALSAGSFSTYKSALSYTAHRGRFSNHLLLSLMTSANDYRYPSVTDFRRPLVRLNNADVLLYGINNASSLILPSSRVDLRFNYTRAARGIPPPITSTGPIAFQQDEGIKLGMAWSTALNSRSDLSFNAAYMRDVLFYYPVRNADSKTEYYVNAAPLSARWNYNRWSHHLNIHLSSTFYHVNSTELTAPDEVQTYGTIELDRDKAGLLQYGFSVQQLMVKTRLIEPSYRLYVGTRIVKGLNWNLSFASTKQVPTINDRYWPLSGNPDLKVETNRSLELGLNYSQEFGNLQFVKGSLAIFNGMVDDWIGWIQVSGDFWKPFNVQKVQSRGLDLRGDYHWAVSSRVKLLASYNLSVSNPIVIKKYSGSPAQEGKRLIYTPAFQHAACISLELDNHLMKVMPRYTSSRFTTADNKVEYSLDPFVLLDFEYNYHFKIRKSKFTAVFKVNNVFNEYYEMIAYRPMAGRYFEVGLGAGFGQ